MVADGHMLADASDIAGPGVHNAVFLDAAPLTDHDLPVVTPEPRPRSYPAAIANSYLADDLGRGMDVSILANLRDPSLEFINGHHCACCKGTTQMKRRVVSPSLTNWCFSSGATKRMLPSWNGISPSAALA